MNIHTKLTLRFTLIAASILVAFSFSIYWFSEQYRREEFLNRLENRAFTTARLLITVQEVDYNLLRIIDKNSINALFQEKVLVFDQDNHLIYSSLDDFNLPYSDSLLNLIRHRKKIEYSKDQNEHVGICYSAASGEYLVLASAYDRYGKSKLNNLFSVLGIGLAIGIFASILFGMLYSRQVLAPLAKMNEKVLGINAGNLDQRIDEGNRSDEIAKLAMNFNHMLERIESAFHIQQQFVSNASHELRTPLTAISSQLQLLLSQRRQPEIYEKTLHSILDDSQSLVALTNGLLNLAQSSIEIQRIHFQPVRVDEVIYSALKELSRLNPTYHFQFEYRKIPDEESFLQIKGNETLLKTAFLNLMDNACKFSQDHTCSVSLSADKNQLKVMVEDHGIGIPLEEQPMIFNPFYRASNIIGKIKGSGIGLALSDRIIRLHHGTIHLNSTPGIGSVFTVTFSDHQPGF